MLIKRVLMYMAVLGGVATLAGFFLPWVVADTIVSEAEHISGWKLYSEYDMLMLIAVPAGATVTVIFGLLAARFQGVAVLKGIALSGALAAAVAAGGMYYVGTQVESYITGHIGESWVNVDIGYGLTVCLAGASVAWLLSILGLTLQNR